MGNVNRTRVRLGKRLYSRLLGYCHFYERKISDVVRDMVAVAMTQVKNGDTTIVEFCEISNQFHNGGGSPEIAVLNMDGLPADCAPDFIRGVVASRYNELEISTAMRKEKIDALDNYIKELENQYLGGNN